VTRRRSNHKGYRTGTDHPRAQRPHGQLGLSQNPCNVFGNGDRDDGDCDGNSYLFDDGHIENGRIAFMAEFSLPAQYGAGPRQKM
jgi:hypothetical protein